jgi:hypothetical protein
MVKSCPAITAVPVRCAPVVGATLKETRPGPAPEAGVTEIQSAFGVAAHGHAGAVVTTTEPVAPDAVAANVVLSMA